MNNDGLDNIIDCPVCGREMKVELEPGGDSFPGMINKMFGMKDMNTSSYRAERVCASCGATILVSLTISALAADEGARNEAAALTGEI